MSTEPEVPQPEPIPSEPPLAQRSFITDVAVLVTGETVYHGAPYLAHIVADKLTPPPGKHAAGREQPAAGDEGKPES